MTNLHRALQTFWGSFVLGSAAIAAYPIDNVPKDAPLPYITYDVLQGAYFSATLLTAIVWLNKITDPDADAHRALLLDAIAAEIPEEGRTLTYDDGAVMLRRNDANFLSYYDDPEDTMVIGGRVSYEATFYNP